ncbi:MAG: hypothetical protein ACI4MJ_06095, partial [Aristaeellaceae bacterium]
MWHLKEISTKYGSDSERIRPVFIGYSETKKDAKKPQKSLKKVLTKTEGRVIMSKLTRESTAPNLENDTET